MINEDLILMFTIRGFLLANKEEDLAESLKSFVNRHPEMFEDKPEVKIDIAEPDEAKPTDAEEIKIRKNYKTVTEITADNKSFPLKKKRFLHKNTPIIQKFNGLIVKTGKVKTKYVKS